MQTWILTGLAIALGVATLALAVALVGARRQARALHGRISDIETRLDPLLARESAESPESTESAESTARDSRPEYLITDLVPGPEPAVPAVPERIDGKLFADLVLRETVVKGASWVHGVRRALEPENRFRMRYAFRSEVKRSRKQRRADLRAARRLVAKRRRLREDVA